MFFVFFMRAKQNTEPCHIFSFFRNVNIFPFLDDTKVLKINQFCFALCVTYEIGLFLKASCKFLFLEKRGNINFFAFQSARELHQFCFFVPLHKGLPSVHCGTRSFIFFWTPSMFTFPSSSQSPHLTQSIKSFRTAMFSDATLSFFLFFCVFPGQMYDKNLARWNMNHLLCEQDEGMFSKKSIFCILFKNWLMPMQKTPQTRVCAKYNISG